MQQSSLQESPDMLKHLFTPIHIGKMEVKNRIGLPPMTLGYGTEDGALSERKWHAGSSGLLS
jgi:2,4-dienoyl-CoA reductase-like NADH-dependent reductase (Old Yellow Enzyme family)